MKIVTQDDATFVVSENNKLNSVRGIIFVIVGVILILVGFLGKPDAPGLLFPAILGLIFALGGLYFLLTICSIQFGLDRKTNLATLHIRTLLGSNKYEYPIQSFSGVKLITSGDRDSVVGGSDQWDPLQRRGRYTSPLITEVVLQLKDNTTINLSRAASTLSASDYGNPGQARAQNEEISQKISQFLQITPEKIGPIWRRERRKLGMKKIINPPATTS